MQGSPLFSLYPRCTTWLSDINHRVIKWTTRRKAGSHAPMQNSRLYYRPPLMPLFPLRSAARIWVTAHLSAAVSLTDNIWVLWSLCNNTKTEPILVYQHNYISTSSSYHVIINPVSSSKNKRIMNANAKAPAYTGVHFDRLAALFCLSLTPGIIPTGLIWTSLHPLVSSCFGQ